LVGVYLALYLSRTYEAKREQDDVIDLIFAIREDAGNIRYMNTLLMETNKGKTYYYEPRRTLLQNFINSEKLVTNIVRSTLRNLLIVSGEITQFQSAINPQMNNRESESQLTLYNIYLTRIMELSNIEINFIRKDVDYDTFADMQNQSLLRLYYRIDSLKAIDSLEAVKSFEKIESQQPVDTLE
jgi:hypothetical protein